jgi:hypothetical protein
MKKMSENVGAWLRGLVWTAMVFGCAWASAQSYLVPPSAGHYRVVAMGAGEGVGLGAGVGAQNSEPIPKDDLFAGTEVFAKNATHVTEITMDPDSLNMVGGQDQHKAHSMVLNVVRSYEYDKPGMYNMADVDAFRNKLNTGDWRCSIHTRDLKTGDGSDVCGKHRTDGMREEVIIEVSPTHLTFVHTIRRADAPGSSELGYFPMLPGMSGLPAIAMLDPEALADMEIGLNGMPFVWTGAGSSMMLAAPLGRLYTMSPEMKLKMDDMQKRMKDLKVKPFSQEQMKQLQDEYKYLDKDYGDMKDRYGKSPEAPAAPATPGAAPTPQVAPVSPTPRSPQ